MRRHSPKLSTTLAVVGGALSLALLSGCQTGSKTAVMQPRSYVPAPYTAPDAAADPGPALASTSKSTGSTAGRSVLPPPIVSGGAMESASGLPQLINIDEAPAAKSAITKAPAVKVKDTPSLIAKGDKDGAALPKLDGKGVTYKVQRGDTLSGIAKKYGVSTAELAAFNKLDEKKTLKADAVLSIPPGGKAQEMAKSGDTGKPLALVATAGKSSAPAGNGLYRVEKGDSVSEIAHQQHVKAADIIRLNNLNAKGDIQVGQLLALNESGAKQPEFLKSSHKSHATPAVAKTGHDGAKAAPAVAKTGHDGAKAAPVAAVATAAPAGDGKHVVASGESLWIIAKKYNTTVSKLQQLNSLKNNNVFPGQTLVVSDKSGAAPAAAVAAAPAAATPVAAAAATPAAVAKAPAAAGAAAKPAPAAATPEQVKAMDQLPHYVEPGDTLDAVAAMYNSKREWILQANPNVKSDADLKSVSEITVPSPNVFR